MHIVTVEDEPIVAKYIVRLTNELLGEKLTKIKWFNNIDDALDYLADNPIDLNMKLSSFKGSLFLLAELITKRCNNFSINPSPIFYP